MTLRILITGSRDWTDAATIDRALRRELSHQPWNVVTPPPVLIHGAAAGADTLADDIWQEWRRRLGEHMWAEPERYPARDFSSPRARNQHMVDLGVTVCLAFAHTWASGTGMCARMARRAGIHVIDYGVPTGPRGTP